MKITQHTRISDLIKANKDVIEALASINKHFEKLRNPILRKVLAPRVTIADAAKIGGCDIQTFFKKLEPLGFICTTEPNGTTTEEIINKEMKPVFDSAKITELDVRGILAGGQDPFSAIMDALGKMPEGNTLKIINTFEPAPLIKILNKKGYSHFTEYPENNTVLTYFTFSGQPVQGTTEVISKPVTVGEFDSLLSKFGSHIVKIDVRDLEMPQPMVKILKELESLPEAHMLFVQHKKVPQYLLPELAEKGFRWLINEISEGNVQLLIYKE